LLWRVNEAFKLVANQIANLEASGKVSNKDFGEKTGFVLPKLQLLLKMQEIDFRTN